MELRRHNLSFFEGIGELCRRLFDYLMIVLMMRGLR